MSARAQYNAARVHGATIDERKQLVKGRTDIVEIARGMVPDLKRKGSIWQGCCPIHNESSPSFSVYPGDQHFHCYGCEAHGDVIELVMKVDGCSFMEALDRLEGGGEYVPVRAPAPQAVPDTAALEEKANRLLAADRTWIECAPLRHGDAAARYLAGRGLVLPAFPEALRFHPALRHPENARTYPALVARVTRGGDFAGIHRTYLELDGDQVGKARGVENTKLSLGEIVGGAIRLSAPGAEPERLGVAEGIESALAASLIFKLPVWACIDAGKLAAFRIPFFVRELLIFADKDLPKINPPKINFPEGAGMHFARRLAARAAADKIAAKIYLPKLADPKCDFADQLARDLKARGKL